MVVPGQAVLKIQTGVLKQQIQPSRHEIMYEAWIFCAFCLSILLSAA